MLDRIGSYELIICALLALYIMAHLIYEDAFKYDVLPVGPPVHELIPRLRRKLFKGT